MIELESDMWKELDHAYGSAGDIPDLLKSLANYPDCTDHKNEPYFSLWSSLCHQGDVYTASYAAVPHIINLLLKEPNKANNDFFLLPTCIEVARAMGQGPEIPEFLKKGYFEALAKFPEVVAAKAKKQWNDIEVRSILAAIAVSKGHAALADAILVLNENVVSEFKGWVVDK